MWYYGIGENMLSGPVAGTTLLPVDPMRAISDGGAARVPVMIGTTRDEFIALRCAAISARGCWFHADAYPRLLESTFADAGAVAVSIDPLGGYGGSAAVAYSTAVTDACVRVRRTASATRWLPMHPCTGTSSPIRRHRHQTAASCPSR